jgi:hypothetical protein
LHPAFMLYFKVITRILRWRLFGGFSACPILRTLVIQNYEFAENLRWAPSMISVRSSLDNGAPNVRLSTAVSGGHSKSRSLSVARTQKLSPAMILANSAILSKIVFLTMGQALNPPNSRHRKICINNNV